MDFRWVIAITLWTIFAGPIFAPPQSSATRAAKPAPVVKFVR